MEKEGRNPLGTCGDCQGLCLLPSTGKREYEIRRAQIKRETWEGGGEYFYSEEKGGVLIREDERRGRGRGSILRKAVFEKEEGLQRIA